MVETVASFSVYGTSFNPAVVGGDFGLYATNLSMAGENQSLQPFSFLDRMCVT